MTDPPASGEGDALSRIERQLDDIEAALDRLDDGSYGICQACGDPVGDERLAADPTALLCERCDHAAAGPPEHPSEPEGA